MKLRQLYGQPQLTLTNKLLIYKIIMKRKLNNGFRLDETVSNSNFNKIRKV